MDDFIVKISNDILDDLYIDGGSIQNRLRNDQYRRIFYHMTRFDELRNNLKKYNEFNWSNLSLSNSIGEVKAVIRPVSSLNWPPTIGNHRWRSTPPTKITTIMMLVVVNKSDHLSESIRSLQLNATYIATKDQTEILFPLPFQYHPNLWVEFCIERVQGPSQAST